MNYFKNNSVVWDEMRDSGMLTFLQENIKKGKPVTRTELMAKFNEGSLINTMDKITLSTQENKTNLELTPEYILADSVLYGRPLPENANGRPFTSEEITKKSIQSAVKNPVDLDMNKVNAQQARRIIDRIIGFTISPLLWKNIQNSDCV